MQRRSEETREFEPPPPTKYPALPFLILGILKALVRDGFQCIVTGEYDYRLVLTKVKREMMVSGVGVTSTHCAHIFPESGIDDKDDKVRFADLSSVTINHAYL